MNGNIISVWSEATLIDSHHYHICVIVCCPLVLAWCDLNGLEDIPDLAKLLLPSKSSQVISALRVTLTVGTARVWKKYDCFFL